MLKIGERAYKNFELKHYIYRIFDDIFNYTYDNHEYGFLIRSR